MEVEKEEAVNQEVQTSEEGNEIHTIETDLAALNNEESIETTDSAPEVQKEEVVDEPAKEPKKSRSQRRIERLSKENAELKAAAKETVSTPEPKVEIDINDFDDYDSYEKALKEQESEVNTTPSTPAPSESQDNGAVNDLFADGAEDYENFEELVSAPDLAITPDMLTNILESEVGADVAYYLATHKTETREIAEMSDKAQAKALLKIELKLEGKPAKKVRTTQAPKPITPVTGASATGKSLNDDNLTFKEHEALLNARQVNNAGGFL